MTQVVTDTMSVKMYTTLIESLISREPEWKACADYLLMPPDSEEIAMLFPDSDSQIRDRALEVIRVIDDELMVTRGAFYCMLREGGSSDRFASMLALQVGPVINTDDTFFSGSKPLYDQFGSQRHLDRYLAAAKAQGYTPPANAVYFPNLARRVGDPEAWVTRSMGRSYIRKLCESRGWACEGAVNVKAREPESDPLADSNCRPLGDDIIRDRAKRMIQESPDMARMNRKELRQHIIDKHGPSKV